MSPKVFSALLLATVASTLGAGLLTWQRTSSDALPQPPNATVLPLVTSRTDDVARLGVKTNDYSLSIVREGDKWVAADRGNFPLRTVAVGSLLTSIAAMKPIEPKTALASSYPAIGVSDGAADKGSVELSFGLKDNSSAGSIIIGRRSTAMAFDPLGGMFVRTPGESQSWIVQGAAAMPGQFSAWFDETPSYPSPQVQRVRISENGKPVFDAIKEDNFYRPAKPEEGASAIVPDANDSVVKKVTAALVSGTFDDVTPAAKLAFGPESRTVRFELQDGLLLDITLAQANGQTWARFAAEAKPGTAAVNTARDINAKQSPWAYKIGSHRVSAMMLPLVDLTTPPAENEDIPGMPGAGGPPQGLPPGMQGMPPGFPGFPPGGPQSLQGLPQNIPPEVMEQIQRQIQEQQQQQGRQP